MNNDDPNLARARRIGLLAGMLAVGLGLALEAAPIFVSGAIGTVGLGSMES